MALYWHFDCLSSNYCFAACLYLTIFLVILSFTDTQERRVDATENVEMSIKCTGKPKCVPGNECKIEWKLGEGTSNTVDETKRIAVDQEGRFLCIQHIVKKL